MLSSSCAPCPSVVRAKRGRTAESKWTPSGSPAQQHGRRRLVGQLQDSGVLEGETMAAWHWGDSVPGSIPGHTSVCVRCRGDGCVAGRKRKKGRKEVVTGETANSRVTRPCVLSLCITKTDYQLGSILVLPAMWGRAIYTTLAQKAGYRTRLQHPAPLQHPPDRSRSSRTSAEIPCRCVAVCSVPPTHYRWLVNVPFAPNPPTPSLCRPKSQSHHAICMPGRKSYRPLPLRCYHRYIQGPPKR